MRLRSALWVFVPATLSWLTAYAAEPAKRAPKAAKSQSVSYQKQVVPLVNKYCGSCHGTKAQIAGLNLQQFKDEAAVIKGREIWERVALNMHSQHMPPKGSLQPTPKERSLITGWIDQKLAQVDCDLRDPGRVTLRRLNRSEYNNTVRDLLGVDFTPADDFPSDDVGYGFDNIGDVLTISPLLMEKYVAAAGKIADRAIVAEASLGPSRRFEAEKIPETGGEGVVMGSQRTLHSNGEVTVDYDFKKAGEYVIRVRGWQESAGDEPAKLVFRLDGKDLQEVGVDALRAEPKVFEHRTRVEAGKHRVAAAFTNDFYDRGARNRNNRDRNLVVDYVEIVGPVGDQTELPESHRRIFTVPVTAANEKEAARKILANLAGRAFRRPATSAEVDRLCRYVDLAKKEGDTFERGIQLALHAMLVSPNFLFRVELDPKGVPAGKPRSLNDYELASRLSYFLWSSMPDDELFALAAKGQLRKPEVLEKQAIRMLRDPRSRSLVDNFAAQWLTLRSLKDRSPDPKRFASFNDQLRDDMLKETELFFESIVKEDRSVLDLLDGNYTFLNERLAKHYGIDWVKGDHFRRVVLNNDQRRGVLTHASILTITSNPTRTSPVKRGKWVLEQILGTPPPPAPPNVPELEDDKNVILTGTLRQRMEQHRKDPGCASCHARMDPIGFGLENFDAVGRWRTDDGGAAVDASGTLPDGQSFSGPIELVRILKGQKTNVARNLAQQLLTFALGRGLEYYDRCAVNEMSGAMAKKGYRFSAIVTEIVKSEPFRMRKVEGGGTQGGMR